MSCIDRESHSAALLFRLSIPPTCSARLFTCWDERVRSKGTVRLLRLLID
jgi:hypothetical protein